MIISKAILPLSLLSNLRLKVAGFQTGGWPYPPTAGPLKRIRLWIILILYRTGLFYVVDAARDVVGYNPNLPSYSQFEEDKFILEFFGAKPGIYIDVGASHPWRISNTYLLYRRGWRGVTVEPIRRLIDKHKRARPRDIQVHAAAGESEREIEFRELVPAAASTFDPSIAKEVIDAGHALPFRRYAVKMLPLTQIYRKTISPEPVDLLTIDVEGFGLNVLRGTDFDVLRPRMIILELKGGDDDMRMRECLRSHGYGAIRTFGCNEIFCRR